MTNDTPSAKKWQLETNAVRGGTRRSSFGETSEAIFMNSGFCYPDAETAESRFNGEEPGYVYSRYLNPNLAMLEDKLCLIEGAERACVMASGMAAVFASMMCFLKSGDHVVASNVLFSSCNYILTTILPRFGVEVTLVPGQDKTAWEAAFRPETVLVFVESPANPTLEVLDIPFIASLCKKHEAKLIVDNIFATPLLQKPLEMGADIVVYSTTKHMDGQGRTLGGAVLGSREYIDEVLMPFHRHTGPALSPFNAWVILKGLETFPLRMEKHSSNALALAKVLESHPKISRVFYPGLPSHPQYQLAKNQMKNGGGMLAFYLKGGKEEAFRFMNALQVIDISNNLGDAKSLITHPSTTTHFSMPQEAREAIGITQDLLRLSVGIESEQDIIDDVLQALEKV